jgi:hypothetical protein
MPAGGLTLVIVAVFTVNATSFDHTPNLSPTGSQEPVGDRIAIKYLMSGSKPVF